MISSMHIENFKSIRRLDVGCSKINVFIGRPGTGKSNILESLGLFSYCGQHFSPPHRLGSFVRYDAFSNLFYNNNADEPVVVRLDDHEVKIRFHRNTFFSGTTVSEFPAGVARDRTLFTYTPSDGEPEKFQQALDAPAVKAYRFVAAMKFDSKLPGPVEVPHAENLITVLDSHPVLYSVISELLATFGLKLLLETHDSRLTIVREIAGKLVGLPYALLSDTLRRMIFFIAVTDTNADASIVLEEPESHSFPYYTKFIAEHVALDTRNNQFFISTHNPYFLLSLLEKAHKEDISIFVVGMRNFETHARKLSQDKIEELLDSGIDIFFNIEDE